jgi:hypothetical protein
MRIVIAQRYQRRATATLFDRPVCGYSAAMKTALIFAFSLLVAGCASDGSGPHSRACRAAVHDVKTFEVPISRVKPAFISTLSCSA